MSLSSKKSHTIPSLKEALRFWVKLGFISFGGPAGQISIMHSYLVEKKKWISESKFLHALNYCMLLPGPEAQQLATYMGWLLHGNWGGILAGLFFILPSIAVMLGLSLLYVNFGNVASVASIFMGLKPAVIAIVFLALLKIANRSLKNSFSYFIALSSFILVHFFDLSFPLLILGIISIAWLTQRYYPQLLGRTQETEVVADEHELEYSINKFSRIEGTDYQPSRFWKQTGITLLIWAFPLLLFYLIATDFGFWNTLIQFFNQAALVTFGGAYSVLPFVAQVSVEKLHWLNNLQMMDGLALGETTPGPLIMVLSYVGFMGSYQHFGNSIGMGTIGLVVTTYYTFLPSFYFILAGAPLIERTVNNGKIKQLLGLVTAAVVGVILHLTVYLGKAVIFPHGFTWNTIDWIALGWIALSLFVLGKLKWNLVAWILISGCFGWVLYFFS